MEQLLNLSTTNSKFQDIKFGDTFPMKSIDIKPQIGTHEHTSIASETLASTQKTCTTKESPKNAPSIATTLKTQESQASEGYSHTNTVQDKLTKILPTEKDNELDVYITPVTSASNSVSVLTYKPRKSTNDETCVTVHKWVDHSRIGTPVPLKQQLTKLYYCDKCPKSFKNKVYFQKHMSCLCPGLSEPECLKCKYCDKLYCQDKNYRQHLSTHDGINRFTCKRCGEKFMTDTEVMKHRKLYCTKTHEHYTHICQMENKFQSTSVL